MPRKPTVSEKAKSKITTDPEIIKKWVEERNGVPAVVTTTRKGQEIGLLRIRFSKEQKENLKEISWDEFFQKFEENNLAFLYQEVTNEGDQSRFFKFVSNKAKK